MVMGRSLFTLSLLALATMAARPVADATSPQATFWVKFCGSSSHFRLPIEGDRRGDDHGCPGPCHAICARGHKPRHAEAD